jgi:hypothetical protein
MKRSEVVKIVDDYMDTLRSGDYSSVRFSPNVSFEGPFMDSPRSIYDSQLWDITSIFKDAEIIRWIEQ